MEGAIKKIDALIEAGDLFSYDNFANHEPSKEWATSYKPAWVAWTTRVEGATKAIFGKDSAPMRILRLAQEIEVIGNGRRQFEEVHSVYLGALHSARDILEDDTFSEIVGSAAVSPLSSSNRVFIVHGHDDRAKTELEIIITEMGLEPVVLHRQADGGRTLIEKFEHYADVGFAFVMLTPDEIGYVVAEEAKAEADRAKEFRARPNAIFEFGFFVGRLGRGRTCCVYKSPVVVPSDLDGLIYKRFSTSVEEIAYSIGKELKAAGYVLK